MEEVIYFKGVVLLEKDPRFDQRCMKRSAPSIHGMPCSHTDEISDDGGCMMMKSLQLLMEGTATLTVDGRSLRDSAIEHGKVVPSEVIYGRVFVSMYPVQCTEGSTRMYTRTRQQCILLLQQWLIYNRITATMRRRN
jgi:hypothetical protein